jgi:hypothetical protein
VRTAGPIDDPPRKIREVAPENLVLANLRCDGGDASGPEVAARLAGGAGMILLVWRQHRLQAVAALLGLRAKAREADSGEREIETGGAD